MNWIDLLRAVFGLAITLGLIGLAAYGVRRYAPNLMARLQGGGERREKRLKVVETLVLDPSRRLVLVRVDQEERLILLGEGRELFEPRGPVQSPALQSDASASNFDDLADPLPPLYGRGAFKGEML